jgi:hypothetical protein
MSKRKNRSSSPNLPQATLDRARQQLGVTPPQAEETELVEETVEAETEVTSEVVLAAAPSAVVRPRTTRRRTEPVQAKGGRKENYDMDVIKNRLEHPTRMVTESELRQDYSYVIKDLRSMGVLAAALIVAMIVIAQFA